MNPSNDKSQLKSTPTDVPTTSAMTSEDERQELLRTKGSDWARKALKGIAEMHQNEDVRKEVARRLF